MKGKLTLYLFLSLIACAIFSVVIFAGCQTTEPGAEEELAPPESAVNFKTEFITGQGMEFGFGLDGVSNEMMGKCCNYTEVSRAPGKKEVVTTVKIIKEKSDLQQALGVSGNVRLNMGLWNTSSSAKYFKKVNSHVSSVFAIVSAEVEGDEYSIKNPELLDSYNIINNWNNNYSAFRTRCGDLYLHSITTGGKYLGIIEIKTTNTGEQNKVMATLTGAGGGAELDSQFKNGLEKVRENYNLDFQEIIIGGRPAEMTTETTGLTVERMLQRAENFIVDDFDPAVASYRVLFKPYKLITSTPGGDIDAHKKAVDSLATYYDKYDKLWEDLQYVQSHIDDFTQVKLSDNVIINAKDWRITLSDNRTYDINGLQRSVGKEKGFIPRMLDSIMLAANNCWYTSAQCSSQIPPNMVEDYDAIYSGVYEIVYKDDLHPCQNCSDIKVNFPSATDGEYTVFYQGNEEQPYKVYCDGLTTHEVKEYLTLPNKTNNYSGMSKSDKYYRGTDVTTKWSKIGIDTDTLQVDINDITWGSTSGKITFYPWQEGAQSKWKADWTATYSPYAYPRNCDCGGKNSNSHAMIDLRGTPFAVSDAVKWELKGGCDGGGVDWLDLDLDGESKRQWVDIRANNGSCGWAKPRVEGQVQLLLKYIGNK